MLKRDGYAPPDKWLYPIDPNVDYRKPENRMYMVFAWAEAMYHTGELNQQLRLMDWVIEFGGFETPDVIESKLWLAFLWGCCYNFTGPWVILNRFPTPPKSPQDLEDFGNWYNTNFERIRFDTDCRYRKSKMIACVKSYVEWLGDSDQRDKIFPMLLTEDPATKYEKLNEAANSWSFYGRLSCWNYLEALALVTGWKYDLDCQSFLLTDISGSESNRNGVAFMIGREDLTTKHGKLKSDMKTTISKADCDMLEVEGEKIFQSLVETFGHIDPVLRFNVETIMCWTKKRFRMGKTRYLGWDSERTIDEMDFVQEHWGEEAPVQPIYFARKAWLPDHLRCEVGDESCHRGENKDKMPVFFLTGQPLDLINFQNGTRWVVLKNKPQTATKKLW